MILFRLSLFPPSLEVTCFFVGEDSTRAAAVGSSAGMLEETLRVSYRAVWGTAEGFSPFLFHQHAVHDITYYQYTLFLNWCGMSEIPAMQKLL